jgi:hypothetical protein
MESFDEYFKELIHAHSNKTARWFSANIDCEYPRYHTDASLRHYMSMPESEYNLVISSKLSFL